MKNKITTLRREALLVLRKGLEPLFHDRKSRVLTTRRME